MIRRELLPSGVEYRDIPPDQRPKQVDPFRVRVENLRLRANVPAGLNPLRLMALAYRLRGSTDEPEPPIEVTPEPDGTWRVHDGRHRYIAAVIAGRPDVLCVEQP